MKKLFTKILPIVLIVFLLPFHVAALPQKHSSRRACSKTAHKTVKKGKKKTNKPHQSSQELRTDTLKDEPYVFLPETYKINPDSVVNYAKKLYGARYKYGQANPDTGFDCSGFVMHVFREFGIDLPHSSSAYNRLGKTMTLKDAKQGDIIVFTRPGATNKSRAGHVGIVCENDGQLRFIHASSGKNVMSVTVSALSGNYMKRFIKIIRVLPNNIP